MITWQRKIDVTICARPRPAPNGSSAQVCAVTVKPGTVIPRPAIKPSSTATKATWLVTTNAIS